MRIASLVLGLFLLASAAFAEEKEVTINTSGAPAFRLTIPKEAEVTSKGEKTTVQTKELRIYLWRVPNAKSVESVVPHVGDVIKSEFVAYAVAGNDPIKIAGHEARHLKGKGEEADDNDPGTADVVIFTDGKNIYAACVHGERDEAARERPAFLKVLESLKPL